MKKLLLITGLVLLITLLTTCSMIFNTTKTVSPTIRTIGLPDSTLLGSITLTVSGSDMETIEVNYENIPSIITLSVPEGNNRTFELTVELNKAFTALPTTVITSYSAKTTTNITSENSVVTLTMGVGSTKLVIPDARNGRIVQINDISGTGWSTLSSSDIPAWVVTFNPWDVDIDGLGRIVVVNNGSSTGEAILWVIDSISSNVFTPLYTGDGGLVAVTVDKINSFIYFASSAAQLYRCDYTGANLTSTYNMTGINSILGLSVDSEGMIYIAGTNGAGAASVFKYNPTGSGTIVTSYATNLISPRDIMIKNNLLFIADYDSISNTNHKIVQLSTNLDTPVELPNSGSFPMFGPQRFIAVLNKKIYFIDDRDDNTNDLDKLVIMDDITGTGWNSLGTFGTGINQFAFYYGC